eukprot:1379168-Amorphochlora_amoeboformis.AAC.2
MLHIICPPVTRTLKPWIDLIARRGFKTRNPRIALRLFSLKEERRSSQGGRDDAESKEMEGRKSKRETRGGEGRGSKRKRGGREESRKQRGEERREKIREEKGHDEHEEIKLVEHVAEMHVIFQRALSGKPSLYGSIITSDVSPIYVTSSVTRRCHREVVQKSSSSDEIPELAPLIPAKSIKWPRT